VGARLTGLVPVAGAIIAGGRATRLGGQAKGLLDVGGTRIIDRVAAALRPIVNSLVIVANSPDAASWLPGVRVVPDVLEGGGSAAGIHAALRATAQPTIVVAWDLPFVTTELLEAIVRAVNGAPDACVPAGRVAGEFEPMCGWYAPSCAGVIESEWAAGDRSLHGLLRRVSTVVVPPADIAKLGSAEGFFLNVNSEDDLARARRMATDDAAPKSA